MYRKIINWLIYNKLQANIPKSLKVRQFVVSPLFILLITENFMMNNRNDVEYLLSAEGREAIINSHIQGIVAYSTSPIISFTKTPVPMNFSP